MWTLEEKVLSRRKLFTRAAPACALGCLGWLRFPAALAAGTPPPAAGTIPMAAGPACPPQEVHKFDRTREVDLSPRTSQRMQYARFLSFIQHLREEIGDVELIRILRRYSGALGTSKGEQQAVSFPDTTFQTFVAQFRPGAVASRLTLEIVEDTEYTFEIRVTECIWASLFKEAGLDGEIGHAAVCNMDYAWPAAFNPRFTMKRDKTLMQGDDHCNPRYSQAAERPGNRSRTSRGKGIRIE